MSVEMQFSQLYNSLASKELIIESLQHQIFTSLAFYDHNKVLLFSMIEELPNAYKIYIREIEEEKIDCFFFGYY